VKGAAATPIPWPPGAGPALLLEVNARQKNSRGYCGQVGCWRLNSGDGWCGDHHGGVAGSRVERPPAEVFEPAVAGGPSGARPGWSAWGFEAL
jgi:hypothetical protein